MKFLIKNITVTLAMLAMLLHLPPLVYYSNSLVKPYIINPNEISENKRLKTPPLQNEDWANTHFVEFANLKTVYSDFEVWRREDFVGETINIVDGYRVTKNDLVIDDTRETWFFGGSTTWGTGVRDAYTLPSVFSASTGVKSKNFGETGYIARQSLARLTNELITKDTSNRKIMAIFYNGINDVANRCQTTAAGLSTPYEKTLRNLAKRANVEDSSFWSISNIYVQTIQLFKKISGKIGLEPNTVFDEKYYDDLYFCDDDPNRANEIAKSLVKTWTMASSLMSSSGNSFVAVLAPNSFIDGTDREYLDLNDAKHQEMRRQYEVMYPLIRQYALGEQIEFYDFSNIFEGEENIYLDFCHVSEEGHKLIIERLRRHLENANYL